jgi:hypothetical protein
MMQRHCDLLGKMRFIIVSWTGEADPVPRIIWHVWCAAWRPLNSAGGKAAVTISFWIEDYTAKLQYDGPYRKTRAKLGLPSSHELRNSEMKARKIHCKKLRARSKMSSKIHLRSNKRRR